MRWLLIISISLLGFSSVAQKQKMKTIYGYVNDKYTYEAISGVRVFSADSATSGTTDAMGTYRITVPRKSKRIYFHHDGYEPVNIRLAHYTRRLDVRMRPISLQKEKYGELSGKNALAWLPTKHILGALGLRYERFIHLRYSAGLYFDWYYRGRQAFGSEEYTGFKATPTFRYYFMHHKAMGFYVQASAIVGYFDFAKLNYVYPNRHDVSVSVNYIFWTGGVGGAVGAYFAFGKEKHFFLDLNFGFQFMPANYPTVKKTSNGLYEHYPTWWYAGGPGSIIEVKIAIGGIF